MSVSCCLLLFIICLSLHFCDCRRLGSMEKSADRKFDVSTFKIEKNYSRSDHQHAIKDQKSSAEEGSISMNRITAKIKASDARPRYNKERKKPSTTNPTATPDASVSWRVPHEKPSEKDTELVDSDYCPPKTHPPSHN